MNATATLLAAIDAGDWSTYRTLVSKDITAFEPEVRLVEPYMHVGIRTICFPGEMAAFRDSFVRAH